MKLTLEPASPARELRPLTGFAIGRRRLALLAAAREDAQYVTHAEKEIKRLNALLDRNATVIKSTPHLAAVFAPHTTGIEAKIADLQRRIAEIRTRSTEKRKEMEHINAAERAD